MDKSKKYSLRNNKNKQKYTRKNKQPQKTKKYIQELIKIYPECQHDNAPCQKYEGNVITYGEMEYKGIEIFAKNSFQFIGNKSKNIVFFDIGCGNGKIPLYMSQFPAVKFSYGIELVDIRYNKSIEIQQNLAKKYPEFTKKVEFIHGNMLEVNFTEKILQHQCIIWISNLCFPAEITKQLFDKLAAEIPVGSVIGCSKYPEFLPEQTRFESVKNVDIPMSWNQTGSQVHFFRLL